MRRRDRDNGSMNSGALGNTRSISQRHRISIMKKYIFSFPAHIKFILFFQFSHIVFTRFTISLNALF